MPELPEVEWMIERIAPLIKGAAIRDAHVQAEMYESVLNARGHIIQNIVRRGKYILFRTDQGMIVSHNSMSGYWDTNACPGAFEQIEGTRPTGNHIRVQLELPNHTELRFHDPRKFGSVRYTTQPFDALPELKGMGGEALRTVFMDPSAPTWDMTSFVQDARKSKAAIKNYLLNQEKVAGIGNIYATEALWAARINPEAKGSKIPEDQLRNLHGQVQEIMTVAIRYGVDYSKYLRVYRQSTCSNCQGPITRSLLGGRGTYYCPKCQP